MPPSAGRVVLACGEATTTPTRTHCRCPDRDHAGHGHIYDAATGGAVLNVPKYVNKAKPEDSDGSTREKPGTYFLIITGGSATDPWEASITEE
jgi:hypothetical protein